MTVFSDLSKTHTHSIFSPKSAFFKLYMFFCFAFCTGSLYQQETTDQQLLEGWRPLSENIEDHTMVSAVLDSSSWKPSGWGGHYHETDIIFQSVFSSYQQDFCKHLKSWLHVFSTKHLWRNSSTSEDEVSSIWLFFPP